jgi:hypothetical protein
MPADDRSSIGQRADVFRVWKDVANEELTIGYNEKENGFIVGLQDGWFVKIARPTCNECESGRVYLDDHSMPVCRDCGCVNTGTRPDARLVSDAMTDPADRLPDDISYTK